jgi:hypothetical protein
MVCIPPLRLFTLTTVGPYPSGDEKVGTLGAVVGPVGSLIDTRSILYFQ